MEPITSPTLATDPGIVKSAKEFSDALTLDLTDTEIKKAFELIMKISNKFRQRFIYKFSDISLYKTPEHAAEAAAKMVDEFEKEIQNTLAESMDLLVVVDMAPVFDGQPPVVELQGHLSTHYSAKYGFDHEQKEFEVKASVERGEAFYGEKFSTNTQKKRQNSLEAHKAKAKNKKSQT